jgi:hypothetical protein
VIFSVTKLLSNRRKKHFRRRFWPSPVLMQQIIDLPQEDVFYSSVKGIIEFG